MEKLFKHLKALAQAGTNEASSYAPCETYWMQIKTWWETAGEKFVKPHLSAFKPEPKKNNTSKKAEKSSTAESITEEAQ